MLFSRNEDISIVLDERAPEAIYLAACDLQRNLRWVFGREDGFEMVCHHSGRGIYVQIEENGKEEAYTVCVEDERVLITGSDVLGTVFGIYAFATNCLHISPVYRLTDLLPETMEELCLEKQSFSSPERPVRFRGWFLNDEDLLTDFKISGGHRHIDYRFYQNVMDTEVLDMVLETALRLEINLIIPSSFVDIDNPDEEKLVEAVCRRGMYISQHHVEPMGVSYFAADNYMKRRGCENETVSFLANRERMVEIWHYYAEKWSKYGARVIWQLGLRGKADQAVWEADPSISSSMEDRGAIISDAIGTQHNIIRQILGTDVFHSTATLWNEGSELYGKGFLRLPEHTIPVFSDFGIDQMFGEDLFSVGHKMEGRYGIYYHAGYWSLGPHLTEGCSPEKMAYNYRNAAKDGKLCYSILNISNVRPLHISAMINARVLQNPTDFHAKEELLQLDRELFGESGELVHALRREYYASFADVGEASMREAASAWGFYFREYEHLPFIRNAATDGQIVYLVKFLFQNKYHVGGIVPNETNRQALAESAEKFLALFSKAEALEKQISPNRLLYYRQFVRYPILYMGLLTEWCVGCIDLKNEALPKEARIQRGQFACSCMERILQERKILEEGKWENWHRGDKKLDMEGFLKWTERVIDEVSR